MAKADRSEITNSQETSISVLLFWSLPTSFLGGDAAAAGIAAINLVGNLAGFASPYLICWIKDVICKEQVK